MGNVAVIRAAMGRETLLKKRPSCSAAPCCRGRGAGERAVLSGSLTLQTLAVLLVGLTWVRASER